MALQPTTRLWEPPGLMMPPGPNVHAHRGLIVIAVVVRISKLGDLSGLTARKLARRPRPTSNTPLKAHAMVVSRAGRQVRGGWRSVRWMSVCAWCDGSVAAMVILTTLVKIVLCRRCSFVCSYAFECFMWKMKNLVSSGQLGFKGSSKISTTSEMISSSVMMLQFRCVTRMKEYETKLQQQCNPVPVNITSLCGLWKNTD